MVSQTLKSGIECILVDDCGQDDSVDIVKNLLKTQEYMDVMKRGLYFTILHHDHNRGLSAARNTGIVAARGKYVFFLDSDDEILPNCIEDMLATSERYGDVDLVQGSYTKTPGYINNSLKRPFGDFTNDRKKAKACLLSYDINPITAQNRLVRRQLILDNDIYFKEGIIHEDNHWTFFLAKHIKTMAICKIPTYYHRYNPNSITHCRNIEKEIIAYSTLINDFSSNIDPILSGHQKELLLNTLTMTLNAGYYHDEFHKCNLIDAVMSKNNIFEKILLKRYITSRDSIVLHLLIRLYKLME